MSISIKELIEYTQYQIEFHKTLLGGREEDEFKQLIEYQEAVLTTLQALKKTPAKALSLYVIGKEYKLKQ